MGVAYRETVPSRLFQDFEKDATTPQRLAYKGQKSSMRRAYKGHYKRHYKTL